MKYFVEFVVSSLITYAEEVEVEESTSGNTTRFTVHVNPADIGKVIGKHGKTISAIRSLLQAAAPEGHHIRVEIADQPSTSS